MRGSVSHTCNTVYTARARQRPLMIGIGSSRNDPPPPPPSADAHLLQSRRSRKGGLPSLFAFAAVAVMIRTKRPSGGRGKERTNEGNERDGYLPLPPSIFLNGPASGGRLSW